MLVCRVEAQLGGYSAAGVGPQYSWHKVSGPVGAMELRTVELLLK